jgi:penicillin-binding protein-related factor A (putative recombinase)
MATKYKIQGYPTIKLIYKGKVYDYDAKPTKENLIQFLETTVKK